MKQTINKFLVGFLFVIGLMFFFSNKADAATYALFSSDPGGSNMYLTINLNKVYGPGEIIQLTTMIQDEMCSNKSTSGNKIVAQILGPNRSYFGTSQVVTDSNSKKGDYLFSSANFTAPTDGGNFIMRVSHTGTYNYTGRNQVYTSQFDIPFTVTGCSAPVGYEKCSNEDGTCSFEGKQANVQYGCKPFFVLKQNVNNNIACTTEAFGRDPVPGIYKACFYKTVEPIAENIKEANSCINACTGTYSVANANAIPDRFTSSDKFTFPFCGGTSTVTLNRTGFLPGEQMKITSAGKDMNTSGCPNVDIKVNSSSSPTNPISTMKISGGAASFTAPNKPGAYNINFGVPVEDEFGNFVGIYTDYSMNYNVVGSTSNSCNVFSTQNECGAQTGCSWNNACNAGLPLSVKIWANGKNPESIKSTEKVYVTWDTMGPVTDCKCTYPTDKNPQESCGSGIGRGVEASKNPYTLAETKTFTVTCSDNKTGGGAVTTTPSSCTPYYATCFVADTMVDLANGQKKNIQDVVVGDILKGEKTNNIVLGLHRPNLNGKLYSFNGGRYFVTEEHPFKTLDGWKSINPEKTKNDDIGIVVTPLKVGDTLVTDKGLVKIKTIDSKERKSGTELFNFMLTGDHTYYADGYLVHNKEYPYWDEENKVAACRLSPILPNGNCRINCDLASFKASLFNDNCNTGDTAICSNNGVQCIASSCLFPKN